MAKETSVRPSQGTPGRRARPGNQYFEVGKVGRKTGITLKDTGIRDDYGLEPVSGIFSSPGSVQRRMYVEDGSADMEGLDSEIPDVDETLRSRRTPRLPPARASTPRRSNITGSPRRQSSAKSQSRVETYASPSAALTSLPSKRLLNFDGKSVRQSIEARSPFKPTHTLRRSGIGQQQEAAQTTSRRSGQTPSNRQTQRVSSDGGADIAPQSIMIETPESSRSKRVVSRQQTYEPQPIFFDDDDDENEPLPDFDDGENLAAGDDIEGALGLAGSLLQQSPSTPRVRTSTGKRKSLLSIQNDLGARSPRVAASSSRKRLRESDAGDDEGEGEQHSTTAYASHASPRSSKKRARISFADEPMPAVQYEDDVDDHYNQSDVPEDQGIYENGERDDSEAPRAARHPVTQTAKRKEIARPRKQKTPVGRSARIQRESSITEGSDSDGSDYAPVRRQGSVSNVSLRAVTPFEDAGENKTRSGRLVMKPLSYWAGETVVWKNGEVDGVVRASSVEPQKRIFKKRPQTKKKRSRRDNALGAIDERDEELVPSDWEEEVGVLTGQVAEYDPDIGMGNDEYLETEDIAFAGSAIITRQVQGTSFNYAKIQTLPFFGSGVVEIPPGGIKATKNSRKMQMNFFMHKGKVQVTVATPRQSDGADPVSTTDFSITEGGAWIVPRGNNYTIRNFSTTTTAYIFFSQGCEVEEMTELKGQAA